MPTDLAQRFANRIPWISCQNISGQTIPPYSCVQVQQWVYPDVSDDQNVAQPPYAQVIQPTCPIHFQSLYFTGTAPIAPRAFGICARPLKYPQLVALDSPTPSSGSTDAPYVTHIGPVPDQWTLSRTQTGFQMVAAPQTVDGTGYVAFNIIQPGTVPCPVTSRCCANTVVPKTIAVTIYTQSCAGLCGGLLGSSPYQTTMTYNQVADNYVSPTIPPLCGANWQPFYLQANCAIVAYNGFTPIYGFQVACYNPATNKIISGFPTTTLACPPGCTTLEIQGSVPWNRTNIALNVYIILHDPSIQPFPSGPFDSYWLIPFPKITGTNTCGPSCTVNYAGPQSCTGVYTGTFSWTGDCSPATCAPGLAGTEIAFTFSCDLLDAPESIQFLAYGLVGASQTPNSLGYLWYQGSVGGWPTQMLIPIPGGITYTTLNAPFLSLGSVTTLWYGPCPNGGQTPTSTIYAQSENFSSALGAIYAQTTPVPFPTSIAQLGRQFEVMGPHYFGGCAIFPCDNLTLTITPPY